MKNKVAYHAYVTNGQAGERAGSGGNLNELKAFVRAHYGKGWICIIEKVESDGDSIMCFPPEEVARFKIRK